MTKSLKKELTLYLRLKQFGQGNEIWTKHFRINKPSLDIANIKGMIQVRYISKWHLHKKGCIQNDVPHLGYLKFNFQLGTYWQCNNKTKVKLYGTTV